MLVREVIPQLLQVFSPNMYRVDFTIICAVHYDKFHDKHPGILHSVE